jgi:hypothetical protein
LPTAKQLVTLLHLTPANVVLVAPAGFGAVESAHEVPFQRLITDCVRWKSNVNWPTEKHTDVPAHATPLNNESGVPAGVGLVARVQPGAALAGSAKSATPPLIRQMASPTRPADRMNA